MDYKTSERTDDCIYLDRECPQYGCFYLFEIHADDWNNNELTNKVYCPKCGHTDTSDKWWTFDQFETGVGAFKFRTRYQIQYNLNRLMQVKRYGQKAQPVFKNGQQKRLDCGINCQICNTRFNVIGMAFYCPGCGFNHIEEMLGKGLESVINMISAEMDLEELLHNGHDLHSIKTIKKMMLEGCLGDIINSFGIFAENKYMKLTRMAVSVDSLKDVEIGSRLFRSATDFGYESWASAKDLTHLNRMLQRWKAIEQNAGFVNEKYLKNSEDPTLAIGQRLVVSNSDIISLAEIIRHLYTGLSAL